MGQASRHPRGTVIAHDLFQVPGFPAATDFKTLLAHAPGRGDGAGANGTAPANGAPPVGLDMATLGNGYVYHTPLDSPGLIGRPQLHALGAGTLSIVTAILRALSERLATREAAVAAAEADAARRASLPGVHSPVAVRRRQAHENAQSLDGSGPGAVYFDYCSLVWVSYSSAAARPLHLAAALIAAASIGIVGTTRRQMLSELLAMLAALLAGVCIGVLLTLVKPLATFGSEYLVLAVYSPAALVCGMLARDTAASASATAAAVASLPAASSSSRQPSPDSGEISRQLGAASLAPWLLFLLACESFRLGTAYLGALFCSLNGCGIILAHVLSSACGSSSDPRAAAATAQLASATQLLAALLPTLHMNGICGWLLQVLIPITARTGVVLPTDVAVGVVVALITTLPSGCVLAPVHAAKQTRPLRVALCLLSSSALLLALVRSSPFTANAPKRLLVTHLSRELDGRPLDAGLWISAFDASGLRELRGVAGLSYLPQLSQRSAHACELDVTTRLPFAKRPFTTGCYFSLPYFFPLSGVQGKPDGEGAIYATGFAAAGADADAGGAAGGAALTPMRPPEPPAAERLSFEVLRVEQRSRGGGGTFDTAMPTYRVSLRLSGSAQMAIVVPEERLCGWSLAPGVPPPRRSPFAPDERVVFAMLTSGGGGSAGGGRRVWELWLDVRTSEPLHVAVYAHHLSTSHTPELDRLASAMPAELRGDWHWSASSLAKRTIELS